MQQFLDKAKEVFTSNKAKTFYWTVFNGFLALLITIFADLNGAYYPFIVAGLNSLTKYINQTYLS